MNPPLNIWTEIISSSVVPVVIISACGLLCLAFYNRLSAVVMRLRALQRERLSEYKELFHLEDRHEGKLLIHESEQFLHFLEMQTADVLKRASLLRNGIFCLICSIFALVLTSFSIGLSVIFPFMDIVTALFFIIGLFMLLYGLSFALREIKIALDPIKMESDFVKRLLKNFVVERGG